MFTKGTARILWASGAVVSAAVSLMLAGCKVPTESTSGIKEADNGMFSNESVCDKLMRESKNDAKRQGGLDPFPVFDANKKAQVARLTREVAQCKDGSHTSTSAADNASAQSQTSQSTQDAAGPDATQIVDLPSDTQEVDASGLESHAQETQVASDDPGVSDAGSLALTQPACGDLEQKLKETEACIMPGSRTAIIDQALKCAIGEIKAVVGNSKTDMIKVVNSCTRVEVDPSTGEPTAKFDRKWIAGCLAKVGEMFVDPAYARSMASEFAKGISTFNRAVTCGNIIVHIVGGTLESWTAGINTHWRPGETAMDGLPIKRTPMLDEWRRNECHFGGKIPDRDWWPAHGGQAACRQGCTDFVNGKDLNFWNSKQYYHDLRAPCQSKCEFICNVCCSGSGCQRPHLGNRNSFGTPGCDWESKAQ